MMKRTKVVLSLPHPFDGTLNMTLEACYRFATKGRVHVLGHGATSMSAMYSHLRRSVAGTPIHPRIVREGLRWVQQEVLPYDEAVLYNRFTLADVDTPFASSRLLHIIETFWLYSFRRETHFIFVDYGGALGGSREICRELLFQRLISDGLTTAEAGGRVEQFDQDYDADVSKLDAAVQQVFGDGHLSVAPLRDEHDLAPLVRIIASQPPSGREGSAFADTANFSVWSEQDLPRLRNHLSRVKMEHKRQQIRSQASRLATEHSNCVSRK